MAVAITPRQVADGRLGQPGKGLAPPQARVAHWGKEGCQGEAAAQTFAVTISKYFFLKKIF